MIYQILSILTITCMAFTAHANNALRSKCFDQATANQNVEAKELNLDREFVKVGRKARLNTDTIAAVLPTNLSPTNDELYVRDRVIAHASASLGRSELAKDNFLTRFAKDIEQQVAFELGTKTKPKPPQKMAFPSAPAKATKPTKKIVQMYVADAPIEHKFKFDVQALKKEARVSYTGFVESQVEYKLQEDALYFSVREQLSETSTIALTHHKDRYGQRQSLQYQVSW